MAEDKKGFVLYADQKLIFNDLTNEEAGILIKHIFSYVNDENPVLEDRLIDILSILKVKLINKGLHSVLIIDRDTYTLGGLYNKIREEVKHIPNAIKLLGDRK